MPPCVRCEEPCRATDHYEDPAGNPLCDECAERPEYIKCHCGHVESEHKDGQCVGKTPDGKPACACTKFREAF